MKASLPEHMTFMLRSVMICLLLGFGNGFAKDAGFPFFDGTDDQNTALMQDARDAIEIVRRDEFILNLLDESGNPVQGKAVIELEAHEFTFGTNSFGMHKIADGDPAKLTALKAIDELFNCVIVCDYWSQNQKTNLGEHDWQQPDYGFQVAEQLHKRGRYHALIYGFPRWLHEYTTEEEMWQVLEQRISNVAERYGDRITEVDVLNEFVNYQYWNDNPQAQYLKTTVFPDIAVPENGARVLRMARKHFPEAKLVVLEAGIWSVSSPVFQEIYQYHKRLIELDAPYDYIGYQAHFYAKQGMPFQLGSKDFGPRTYMMDEINRGFEQVAQLGKPMVITEFNPPSRNNRTQNPDQPRISDEEIAAWESNFYTLAFSKPYIRGLSRWFTVDNLGGRGMDAGVVSQDGMLKPNYFALRQLIKQNWHTRWQGDVSANPVSFKGFHGSYTVNVDGYEGARVKLGRDNTNVEVVLLKQR